MTAARLGPCNWLLAAIIVATFSTRPVAVGADEPGKPALATLKAALGKSSDSAEVARLRADLSGEPLIETFSSCFFYSWKEHGISVRFDDDAVTSVILYADKADGFKQYPGEMPEGLRLTDTRGDVEKKLGEPKAAGGEGIIPFWASYDDRGVAITYELRDTKDIANPIHHVNVKPVKDAAE